MARKKRATKLRKGQCVRFNAGDRCICRPKGGGKATFRKCSSRTK
jgi:hypothetical protein